MSLSSSNIITKKSGETILAEMEFDEWLAEGITITEINTVTSEVCSGGESDLVITSPEISGGSAVFYVAGGTNGIRYKVMVNITTSNNETLIGDGQLVIED